MTKPFCDICGEPASESFPAYAHKLHDKAWSGYLTTSGGGHDGMHTPQVDIYPVVRMEKFKGETVRKTPDLCPSCLRLLLQKLIEEVK